MKQNITYYNRIYYVEYMILTKLLLVSQTILRLTIGIISNCPPIEQYDEYIEYFGEIYETIEKKRSGTGHLTYMRKWNSGKSSPGVEQEPKIIERAHSGTRKLHRNLNFDEKIHQ